MNKNFNLKIINVTEEKLVKIKIHFKLVSNVADVENDFYSVQVVVKIMVKQIYHVFLGLKVDKVKGVVVVVQILLADFITKNTIIDSKHHF